MRWKNLVLGVTALGTLYAAVSAGFFLGVVSTLNSVAATDAASAVHILERLRANKHESAISLLELQLFHSVQMHGLDLENPLQFRLARLFDFTGTNNPRGDTKVMQDVVQYCALHDCESTTEAVLRHYR